MTCLVTGATGFIGRRLIDALLREGHQVTALVRNDQHNLPSAVQVINGDLGNVHAWGANVEPMDWVFHLAALITFDPGELDQLMAVNAEGTQNLLKACGRWSPSKVVVASSACTIGLSPSADVVLDEEAPLRTGLTRRNPYMASKCACESVCMQFAGEGLPIVVVNPTTVFGPGDASLNAGSLIMRVARGGVLPTPPGGSNVVDVDDVVDGIMAAAERGKAGQRYILGGHNLPFREIFQTVATVVGSRPACVPIPRLAKWPLQWAAAVVGRLTDSRFMTPQIVGDMFAYKYYASLKAESELGWGARHSFADSVQRAWSYYLAQGMVDDRNA